MKKSLFTVSLLFLSVAANASSPANDKIVTTEPLTFYLDSETALLNGYYTIEYFESNADKPSQLGMAQIEPKPFTDLSHFVSYLQKQLPEAKVAVDSANPKVINIIDKTLVQQSDYGLNKTIDIAYNGSLSGLPKAIGNATNASMSDTNSLDGAVIFTYAYTTKINLNLKHASGRAVLTNATFVPRRSGRLWQANSFLSDGKINTAVFFPQPAH